MQEIPWLIILIIFLASAVFATFGFGDALLAMPFLTILLGVQKAAPLLALCGFTLAISLIGTSYKHIDWREALKLIFGSMLGVPIGVYILKHGDDRIIRIAVGIVIVSIALYNLFRPQLKPLNSQWPAPFAGFAGGLLGGLFHTSAPPVVIYGAMRQWSPVMFVGMMQAYFIPTDVFVIVGHLKTGLLNREVLHLFAWCFPFLIGAVALGNQIKGRLSVARFQKGVFVIILISGLMLVIRSVFV